MNPNLKSGENIRVVVGVVVGWEGYVATEKKKG
jgi:hypothetical protein